MAPPRIECINLGKGVLRAGARNFSSTRSALVDPPIQASSAISDLLNLAAAKSSSPLGYNAPAFSMNPSTADHASRLLNGAGERRKKQDPAFSTAKQMQDHKLKDDLTKQIKRRWKAGDVYAPHDLSGVEVQKWSKNEQPSRDIFDMLNFDPMANYWNFAIMSEYMTPMGRIKHSKDTGLRPVNQRKIAKAIRRSIGIGMMPSVHHHPEMLQKKVQRNKETVQRFSSRLW